MGTWNAYANEYWPADYLIDAHGEVRYATFGEGDYAKTETAIRALLAEAGYQVGGKSHPTGVVVPSELATPETYLGTARAQGWVRRARSNGLHDYGPPPVRRSAAQPVRLQRHLEDRRAAGLAVANAGIDVRVRRQGRLPGAELARRTPAAGAGAARRAPDLGCRRRRRRPRRRRHRATPAPVLARLAAARRATPPVSLRFAAGVTGYAFTFG